MGAERVEILLSGRAMGRTEARLEQMSRKEMKEAVRSLMAQLQTEKEGRRQAEKAVETWQNYHRSEVDDRLEAQQWLWKSWDVLHHLSSPAAMDVWEQLVKDGTDPVRAWEIATLEAELEKGR